MVSATARSAVADTFRVYKTLLAMLNNRGYDVDPGLLTMDKKAFDARFVSEGTGTVAERGQLAMVLSRKDDPEDKISVFWTEGAKVGVGPIRVFYESLTAAKIRRGILIVEKNLSPFGKQALAQFRPSHIVEWFSFADLKFDITTHSLVPKHRVLPPEEKRAVLKRLKVKDTQLPRMQTSDPIARYYGLERGQVVEITRRSDTAGQYVTYRIVLPA